MKNIGDFFGKFKSRVAGEVQNRIFIIEILQKYTGIELEMKDIAISGGIIKINSAQKFSSAAKNELFIKKTQILKEINQRLGGGKIIDIK